MEELFKINEEYFELTPNILFIEYMKRDKNLIFSLEIRNSDKNIICTYCKKSNIKYYIKNIYCAKKHIQQKLNPIMHSIFKKHIIKRYNSYIKHNINKQLQRFFYLDEFEMFNIFSYLVKNYQILNKKYYFNDFICDKCYMKFEEYMLPLLTCLNITNYTYKSRLEKQTVKINELKKNVTNYNKLNELLFTLPNHILTLICTFIIKTK